VIRLSVSAREGARANAGVPPYTRGSVCLSLLLISVSAAYTSSKCPREHATMPAGWKTRAACTTTTRASRRRLRPSGFGLGILVCRFHCTHLPAVPDLDTAGADRREGGRALVVLQGHHAGGVAAAAGQGLTLVHFSAQLEPCLTQESTLHTLNTP